MLQVKGIDVFYGNIQALWDITLRVDQGELVAIVGPNGSGKTTILKTIQGLLRPASGEIYFMGQRIDSLPPHSLVDMGLTYIPERRRLFPDMSVQENLEVGAYRPRARAKMAETFELVLDIFPALKDKVKRRAATLSGGEQQMLAVARGLMSRPKLLLLDDPFLGLAPLVIAKFCETIRAISDEGIAILLVGQHVRRILRLAGRAYLLEIGKISMEGAGEELLDEEAVRKALFEV